jgi:hypothetical protein
MKRRVKVLLIISIVILLLICYFALPVRPAIAQMKANHYIERYYSEYGLPSAENVGIGRRSYYSFEWTSSYDFQSQNGEFLVYVIADGWFPFIIQDSYLYQLVEDDFVLIDGK